MISNISLTYRIALVIFLLELVMLTVIIGYSLSSYKKDSKQHFNELSAISLNLLAEFSRTALLTGEFSFVQPHFEKVIKDQHVKLIILRDSSRQIVASSSPSIIVEEKKFKQTEYIYWLEKSINNASGSIGTLHMLVDFQSEADALNTILMRSIIIALFGMLIIAFIAISAGHFLTRKINRITMAAREFSNGNNKIKTYLSGKNEIDQLGSVFDSMTESIGNQTAILEKEVEERTQSLKELNKELETFSYSISHDLRSPLRIIEGFCVALEEDCEDKINTAGKEYLSRIKFNVNKMEMLIDDMLIMSRINRSEPKFERCSINDIANNVSQDIQSQYTNRQVEFNIENNLFVQADKKLLSILFKNALENAWKFTSKRELTEITIGKKIDNNNTVYFIKDNGVGFNSEYVDQVFDPFKRMHNEKEYHGTGLGLAIIQQVMRRHKGSTWIESEVDQGTTLFFSFEN